ncbi:fatty acid/sphingolipid desaturase [Auriscalpium vulgare]|uniref:Fatty acid/sphingolipid desaturase n=1 Tax=Auriscalpium vulgare TaxID=40419 RepID=A0ACB8S911_9AGAM|nr:fatty acid/sphingolipid desaturase [Auriscalpium vulgare]
MSAIHLSSGGENSRRAYPSYRRILVDAIASKIHVVHKRSIYNARCTAFTLLPLTTIMETFSRERVRELEHVIIDSKVYAVKDFGLTEHPGGEVLLTQLGRDATDIYRAFHPDVAYQTLASFYVGDLDAADVIEPDGFTLDIRALDAELRKRGYYNPSLPFYVLIHGITLSLLGLSVFGVYNFGHTLSGVLVSAVILALFFQQCGWLSHDFCHNEVSDSRFVSRAGAIVWGPLMQGFSVLWWTDKHNHHHAATNIRGSDPDIEAHPFLAFSEDALELFADVPEKDLEGRLAKVLITHQVLCYFPLLTFARLLWNMIAFAHDFLMPKRAWIDCIGLVVHWYWFSHLVRLIPSPTLRALFVFVAMGMGGQFMAMVFAPNHIGTLVQSKAEWEKSTMGYYVHQVITTRDIRSSIVVEWFCGGLNQQITHHLFPRMSRHRYREIQPIVKGLCEKHGLEFREVGFWEGQRQVMARLNDVANAARKRINIAESEAK